VDGRGGPGLVLAFFGRQGLGQNRLGDLLIALGEPEQERLAVALHLQRVDLGPVRHDQDRAVVVVVDQHVSEAGFGAGRLLDRLARQRVRDRVAGVGDRVAKGVGDGLRSGPFGRRRPQAGGRELGQVGQVFLADRPLAPPRLVGRP
jgi:hypothetical protein